MRAASRDLVSDNGGLGPSVVPAAAGKDARRHNRRDAGGTVCGIEKPHFSRQKTREKWGTRFSII
jgi:hypothetical protein